MKLQIFDKAINRATCLLLMMFTSLVGFAQDAEDSVAAQEEMKPAKVKPVKNIFESVWIIDNQTVLVPVKKTFEMDIMHRFGTVDKQYEDFWGFFAPSNIRLGFSYVPIKNLNVSVGVVKTTATIIPNQDKPASISGPFWDGSLKYSIITQT